MIFEMCERCIGEFTPSGLTDHTSVECDRIRAGVNNWDDESRLEWMVSGHPTWFVGADLFWP